MNLINIKVYNDYNEYIQQVYNKLYNIYSSYILKNYISFTFFNIIDFIVYFFFKKHS